MGFIWKKNPGLFQQICKTNLGVKGNNCHTKFGSCCFNAVINALDDIYWKSLVKWEVWEQGTEYITCIFESSHEIMALFVLHKLILQTRMCSHPVGLDVWCLVWPFFFFHTSCVRTAKALARLRGCAGSTEPSLVAYVIKYHNLMSWLIYLYFLIQPYHEAHQLYCSLLLLLLLLLLLRHHNLLLLLNYLINCTCFL